MAVALKQPWIGKPPTHAAKLRPGLGPAAFSLLLNGNLRQTGNFYRSATFVAGSLPIGPGLVCDGSTYHEIAGVADWPSTAPQNNGEMTCVAVCRPNGIGSDAARAIAGNTLGSAEKGWVLSYENRVAASSPNAFRAVVFNGAGGTRCDLRVGAQLNVDSRCAIVFGCSSVNAELHVNGYYGSASWGAHEAYGNSTRTLQLGRGNWSSLLLPFVGLIESITFINKRMPAWWMNGASLDPYNMLFEPRKFWVPHTVAGAAPTLSDLRAVNIGATSSQWSIDYTF